MGVALRKESVDRNLQESFLSYLPMAVALRKESVDRNILVLGRGLFWIMSLSARRAWIEMEEQIEQESTPEGRSPQGERG